MRTKIIAALLAVLTALGGLNLFQSIKDRLFPPATAQTSQVSEESNGRVRVKVRNKDTAKVRVREGARETARVRVRERETVTAKRSGDVVIDERFDVREGQTLVIDVVHSDVTIETGNVDEAHVTVSLTGRNMSRALEVFEAMNFEVEMVGDELRIESEAPDRNGWRGNVSMGIDIDVTIPVRFNARMKTTHGDVELDDIDGRVELRTTHGDVDAQNILGPEVAIISTHGSIEAETLSSEEVVLRTTHADISVEEVSSRHFSATTSHSDIRVRDLRGDAEITTSHGDIAIALSESIDAELQTSHGDVVVYAPSNITADLDLKGARVKISSSFEFRGDVEKDQVDGAINGGGAKIRARTSHGTVSVINR